MIARRRLSAMPLAWLEPAVAGGVVQRCEVFAGASCAQAIDGGVGGN